MLGSSYKAEDTKSTVKLLSCVRLFVIPWTVAYWAPLSMEFSRQEYCSGLPFPSPGDLPNPGIEPGSPALQADAFTACATREASKYEMDPCNSSVQMACRFGTRIKQHQGHRLRGRSWTLCHQLRLQQWLHILSAISSPSPGFIPSLESVFEQWEAAACLEDSVVFSEDQPAVVERILYFELFHSPLFHQKVFNWFLWGFLCFFFFLSSRDLSS